MLQLGEVSVSLPEDIQLRLAEAQIASMTAAARRNNVGARAQEHELAHFENDQRQNSIFPFFYDVSQVSVYKTISDLDSWSRRNPGKALTVVFNSPGGEVLAGFALFDYLRELSRRGHHVTTKAVGAVASMASILLQAGDTRVMSTNAYMMLHEPHQNIGGMASTLKDAATFLDNLDDKGATILSERSNLSKRQIKNLYKRRDHWLDAVAALKAGFIDYID